MGFQSIPDCVGFPIGVFLPHLSLKFLQHLLITVCIPRLQCKMLLRVPWFHNKKYRPLLKMEQFFSLFRFGRNCCHCFETSWCLDWWRLRLLHPVNVNLRHHRLSSLLMTICSTEAWDMSIISWQGNVSLNVTFGTLWTTRRTFDPIWKCVLVKAMISAKEHSDDVEETLAVIF